MQRVAQTKGLHAQLAQQADNLSPQLAWPEVIDGYAALYQTAISSWEHTHQKTWIYRTGPNSAVEQRNRAIAFDAATEALVMLYSGGKKSKRATTAIKLLGAQQLPWRRRFTLVRNVLIYILTGRKN